MTVIETRVTTVPITEEESGWMLAQGWRLEMNFGGPTGLYFPIDQEHTKLINCLLQLRVFEFMAGVSA